MSSLASLRTFLRSTSDNNGSEPGSATCSPATPMRSFPSMDDFSCGASRDAEACSCMEQQVAGQLFPAFEKMHRGSLDGSNPRTPRSSSPIPIGPNSILAHCSMDAALYQSPSKLQTLSVPGSYAPSSSFHHHHHRTPTKGIPRLRPRMSAQEITPVSPLASSEPAGHDLQQAKEEGKIDGMDYYGWCELLRSSSL